MKQIDRRTNPTRHPMSRRWYAGWMCVGLVMLGWAFWNRAAIGVDALFLFVSVIAISTGMALAGVIRDF